MNFISNRLRRQIVEQDDAAFALELDVEVTPLNSSRSIDTADR